MNPAAAIETNKGDSQPTDAVQLVDQLNEQSFDLRHKDPAQSATLAHRALNLAAKTDYQRGRAKALLNIGFQELNNAYYDKAFQMLREALQIFQTLNYQSGRAQAYYYLGLVYLRLGDYDNSMQVFQDSMRISNELNDQDGIFTCRSHTAFINSQFGQHETSIREYNECIAFWQKGGDESKLASALMGLGVVDIQLGRLRHAKNNLLKSINIRWELSELTGWAGSINYLCDVYIKEGKATQALSLLEEAHRVILAQPQPFAAVICRLLTNLAKVHAQMQHFSEAERYLQEAVTLATETKQQYQLHGIYLELAQL